MVLEPDPLRRRDIARCGAGPESRPSVRTRLETNGDTITDLHLWRLGPGHTGLIVSLVSDHPQEPAAYKTKLADLEGLSHITVEANLCPNHGAERIPA